MDFPILARGPGLFALCRAGVFLLAAAAALSADCAPAQAYQIRPMDLLKVSILDEVDLNRELRVSQDYRIVLPLVGQVELRGMTVRAAEMAITKLYQADYLKNPQVNITITEYAPRVVNVLGAVNVPGSIVLPPERAFTLLDAIARAGGFSRLANRNRVVVTVNTATGSKRSVIVNADEIVTGDQPNNLVLDDGDVVYVPERML